MSYKLKSSGNENLDIVVVDGVLDKTTDLDFPGKNYSDYGKPILQNFYKLLENFASSTEPSNPVVGQLWFNTTETEQQLKVYNNNKSWVSITGINRSVSDPNATETELGDLWVDTNNQQLYLNSGSGWILVGPDYAQGLASGAFPKTITGTADKEYTVIQIELANIIIAIISTDDFIPKKTIPGFSNIRPGLNLADTKFLGSDSQKLKLVGTAETAESLLVGNNVINASKFVRNDRPSTTEFPISILDGGLILGNNADLKLSVEGQVGVIQQQTLGSSLDLRVRTQNDVSTVIRVDSSQRVGINNTAPNADLDVAGDIKASGDIKITSVTPSPIGQFESGSLTTVGGVGVGGNLNVARDTFLQNTVTIGGNVIPDEADERVLGSKSRRFDTVYTKNVNADFVTANKVTATLVGTADKANKLSSSTTFRMLGDVEAPDIVFTGSEGDISLEFNTVLSTDLINAKQGTTSSNKTDEILVNRIDGTPGLYKVSQRTLLESVPTNPPGTVVAYAGIEPPVGWLICDGSSYFKQDYLDLYAVIKDTFLTSGDQNNSTMLDKFRVPDLRGRNPLGADNMGGADAGRVNQSFAKTIGGTGGKAFQYIGVNNLPQHTHDLKSGSGNQYYLLRDIDLPSNDNEVIEYDSPAGPRSGQALTNSGGIATTGNVGESVNIMNPAQTLSYIIYTGKN